MNILKLILILVVLAGYLFSPSIVRAEEEVCTQSYGQPVVCGKKSYDEPVIVETGIKENLRILGAGMIATSGILYFFSKRRENITFNIVHIYSESV